MSQLPNVVIIMCHCSGSREPFGMRLEQKSRDLWEVDWAFRLQEKAAKKEGYDQNDIQGVFAFGDEYPGCPYCHNKGAILCPRCDKVSCIDPRNSHASCGWCSFSGQTGGGPASGLKAGGDV